MLPSFKTHPVFMTLVAVGVFIAQVILWNATGYGICVLERDSANLFIVNDDVKFDKENEENLKEALDEDFRNAEELRAYEESECAKCYNNPAPAEWDNFLQPDRDNEGGIFD